MADKSDCSIDIGVARQPQRQVILRGRRISRHTGRQWATPRQQCSTQCRLLALQAGALILEYGPGLRRALASPAGRLFGAQRLYPGSGGEAQKAVRLLAEEITAALGIRCRFVVPG